MDNAKYQIAIASALCLVGVLLAWCASSADSVSAIQAKNIQGPNASSSNFATAHVLVYHSIRPIYEGMSKEVKRYTVSPETFETQLRYLRDRGYSVISLDGLVSAAREERSLPEKSVILTFDDGWKNQYTYAFPILKKYSMTATFFIFTNAIDRTNYMTWDDLIDLSSNGMSIGSHSQSHPYLRSIADEKQLLREFSQSKLVLESKLGRHVEFFAYPFGEYSKKIALCATSTGYVAARMFSGGIYHQGDDLLSIKGIPILDDMGHFKKILSEI